MSDLKAHTSSTTPPKPDELDGLDESTAGVPAPNAAAEFTGDYAMPAVVPRRVHPLAVLAVILALPLPFVAIPLAHWTMRRLQHSGGRGRSVANAAVIVGYLSTLLLALVALNIAVAAFLHR